MNSLVDGSKYFVVSGNGFQFVKPFWVESVAFRHSNTVPYLLVFKPKCVLYHSFIFPGSLHLKKMPPIPVTLFIVALPLELLVVIDLKAKPKQNDAAKAIASKIIFFIAINAK